MLLPWQDGQLILLPKPKQKQAGWHSGQVECLRKCVWNRGSGHGEGADEGNSDMSLICAPGRAFWLAGSTNTDTRTGWHRLRGRGDGESPMGFWRHSGCSCRLPLHELIMFL